MKNNSFEDGWTDLPPAPGYLINQQPNSWTLTWKEPGEYLTDSGDVAQGVPECRHLSKEFLPEDEWPGGENALILDGEWTYKMFHANSPFEARLQQTITGLKPGSTASATFYVQIHDHKTTDPYAVEFGITTSDDGRAWFHVAKEQLQHKAWAEITHDWQVAASGEVAIDLIFKSKYGGADVFIDAFEFVGEFETGPEPPDPPPDDVITEIWEAIAKLETATWAHDKRLDSHEARITDIEKRVAALEGAEGLHRFPLGVDVSYAQGYDCNWPELAANGVVFASIRCGSGKTPKDFNFDWNWLGAGNEGILRFPMWFLYHEGVKSPEQQAQEFAALVPDDAELWPCYNLEKDENGYFVDEAVVLRFLDEFQRLTGYRPRIYTAAWVINGRYTTALDDGNGFFADWGDNASIPTDNPILPNGWQQPWRFWQWTSRGGDYVGHVKTSFDLDWFNGTRTQLEAYSKEYRDFVKPPPISEIINIRPYFEPAGDVGPYKVLAWLDGSKTQPQQLIKRDGYVLEAKGEGQYHDNVRCDDYERWEFAGSEMRRWEDTSPGWPKAYTQHGARWLPEIVEIGKQYVNQPRLTTHNRVDCSLISDTVTTDYLTVIKRDEFVSPYGLTVDDAIYIEWRKSKTGPVEEVYIIGKGMGYLGWGVGELEAAISELPEGREPLNPLLWGCG